MYVCTYVHTYVARDFAELRVVNLSKIISVVMLISDKGGIP